MWSRALRARLPAGAERPGPLPGRRRMLAPAGRRGRRPRRGRGPGHADRAVRGAGAFASVLAAMLELAAALHAAAARPARRAPAGRGQPPAPPRRRFPVGAPDSGQEVRPEGSGAFEGCPGRSNSTSRGGAPGRIGSVHGPDPGGGRRRPPRPRPALRGQLRRGRPAGVRAGGAGRADPGRPGRGRPPADRAGRPRHGAGPGRARAGPGRVPGGGVAGLEGRRRPRC